MMKKFLMTGALCSPWWRGRRQVTAADPSQNNAEPVPPASAADIPAGTYTLDRSHASLIFRVNHLGFSNYTARFKRFDAKLQFDPRIWLRRRWSQPWMQIHWKRTIPIPPSWTSTRN